MMSSARNWFRKIICPAGQRFFSISMVAVLLMVAPLGLTQPGFAQAESEKKPKLADEAAQNQQTSPIELTARLQGNVNDKPIIVGYARNISPPRIVNYVLGLTERLGVGKTFSSQMNQDTTQKDLEQISPRVSDPLYGLAVYMVSGLIPSFETISFQQVVDEEDARRLIEGRKGQWGNQGSLTDRGNGCYTLQNQYSSTYPLPPGSDEKQYLNNQATQIRGHQVVQKIVEKDGVKHVEHTQTMQTLFRYHDTILYEANFEELFDMTLPSADAIASAVDGSTDLGFQAYLDRIPLGIRQLGWNMLGAAAGSQLQQRDDESDTSYNMRKSGGDLALGLIQAVLFDIDNTNGWAKFATADDDSLRGEVRIRARNNSDLTSRLTEAAGNSRFAPILGDTAAATLHLCVRLPAETTNALQATANWLSETVQQEFSTDPGMLAVSTAISGVLNGIGEHRTLELLLKAGWTEASNGVIYGGIQLNDEPDLLKHLHYMLTYSVGADPQTEQAVAIVDTDGLSMIMITVPAEATEEFRRLIGINLTHIFLAHQNSCLWFAMGTENSREIIRASLSRCTENARAARTPLASGRIDMERWLSYPQDDPAHIAQMPYWLDENARWFPPLPLGFAQFGDTSPPTPIMQSVFDLGGAQQAGFSLEADESGLLLQVSLGEALANHMLARMIDNQESMMQRSAEMMEQERQSRAALEKATKELQPPP